MTLFDEDVKLNSVVISDIDVIIELRVNSWFMLVLTSERQETFFLFWGQGGLLVACLCVVNIVNKGRQLTKSIFGDHILQMILFQNVLDKKSLKSLLL